MIQSNLWEKVGNRCLQRANSELENMEHLTEDGVGLVQKLVSIAIAIDQLNLQWAVQNRYGAAAYRGPVSVRTKGEN